MGFSPYILLEGKWERKVGPVTELAAGDSQVLEPLWDLCSLWP